jgi:hypothetical protein
MGTGCGPIGSFQACYRDSILGVFTTKSLIRRLLASPFRSVRLFACNKSRTTKRAFFTFDIGQFY